MWIYCLPISRDFTDDEFRALVGTLQPAAAERVARIRHREGAVRALLSEIFTRCVLAQHTGSTPSDLDFFVGTHGKPELVSSAWHYNVSHSGNWIICAVSDSQPVGVDVEQVRDANLAVARRYFHAHEVARLAQTPLRQREDTFFEIWTVKESFLKAVGIGISVALNSFWADDETHTIRIDDAATFARLGVEVESGWCFDLLPLDDGYRLAACSQTREELRRARLDVDELLRRWWA